MAGGTKGWVALGVIGLLAGGVTATCLMVTESRVAEQAPPREAPRGQPIVAHNGPSVPVAAAVPSTDDAAGLAVNFDLLSGFYYEISDSDVRGATAPSRPKDQIPATVRALEGKRVAVQGFMLPLKLANGAATEFLLTKDQALCCKWGSVPRMNEWISVRMVPGKTAKHIPDQTVTVQGVLHVGEEIVNGEVLSVYRMDADDLAGPLDP